MARLLFAFFFFCLSCKNFVGNPHRTPLPPRTVPAVPVQGLRVEPANWWTGLQHNRVEVLVHYPAVQGYAVTLGSTEGVKLEKVEPAESANYVFLTLNIAPNAPPQRVPIVFSRGAETFTYDFAVRARRPTPKAQGVTSRDVVYLIFPDRFANGDASNDRVADMLDTAGRTQLSGRHGGDLRGIMQHLDYLQDLGINTVWLNPELENDQARTSYHGYAVTDHYRVDRRLGSNEMLRELADSLHRRGMKLVRDVVLNHIGDGHYWMKDLPSNDWVNQWPEFTRTSYRAPAMLDPYASEYDKKHFSDGWFDRTMPDLNQRNPHVARYLLQQAIWWIEYAGIDDFRIDTYSYSDQAFCSWWCAELRREYPQLGMFGEVWEHAVPVQGFFADNQPMQRAGFDSNLPGVVDFQLMFALQEALTKEQGWTEGISRVYYVLAQDYFYQDPLKNLTMLDNHDFTRFYTTVGENVDKLKSGLAFLLTMRGIPQLYYGTEILMAGSTNPTDALVRQDFPGGWPGDPANKFAATGRTAAENDVYNFTRALIRYRNATPALQTGKLMQFVPVDGVYVYFRYDAAKTVMVALNTANKDVEIETKRFAERMQGYSKGRNVVTGREVGDLTKLKVGKHGVVVLELF